MSQATLTSIRGVGAITAAKLGAAGITSAAEVARVDPTRLMSITGFSAGRVAA